MIDQLPPSGNVISAAAAAAAAAAGAAAGQPGEPMPSDSRSWVAAAGSSAVRRLAVRGMHRQRADHAGPVAATATALLAGRPTDRPTGLANLI